MSLSPPLDDKAAKLVLTDSLAAWNAAMANWNVQQLLELYDEQALFLGSTPPLHTGKDGVRAYFEGIPGSSSVLELIDMEVAALCEEIVIASGYARFESVIGGNTVINKMRISFTFVQRDSGWKIASHHVSPRE